MTLNLKANSRAILGKKTKSLREVGKIPAVVFGNNQASASIELDYIPFEKIFKSAGESTLIDLELEGNKEKVIISEIQVDPIKGKIIHADLKRVNMKKEISANIPLEFFGESKAVKEEGGIIVHNISEVEIKCLPTSLIHEIKIDISKLETFDDLIHIKDLPLPEGVEIIHHEPEDVVLMVAKPKEEKEEEVVAPTEVAEGEKEAGEKTTEEKKAEEK
jgi:large subunit ribosomal protein L25